ncbi:uncharacterized protein EAE97_003025 [Botrytis byssoidea]|uniref:Uncharacterized protein n=1 Tax=Botrytis byssoidea TaxID=139641 RepID=A0A9P5IRZ1_9HELO|nr:uncharacterized protein EAE97_003025 [Botrytis byssoidea]KAF7949516.1 hypothetical protein EAE97_003025 [Botrytis byssoidea]
MLTRAVIETLLFLRNGFKFHDSINYEFLEGQESQARPKGTNLPVLREWGKCTLQTLVVTYYCYYGGFYQKWFFVHIKRNQTQPGLPGISIDSQLRHSCCIIPIHTVDGYQTDE